MRRSASGQRGFALIMELLMVMIIVIILSSVALLNATRLRLMTQQAEAHQQVRNVAQAISSYNICILQTGLNCAPVAAMIPKVGPLTATGYTFTFSGSPASYTYIAVPLVGNTQTKYYVDNTGLVRCGSTATSSVCP